LGLESEEDFILWVHGPFPDPFRAQRTKEEAVICCDVMDNKWEFYKIQNTKMKDTYTEQTQYKGL
jgi:hypothetical protein